MRRFFLLFNKSLDMRGICLALTLLSDFYPVIPIKIQTKYEPNEEKSEQTHCRYGHLQNDNESATQFQ